MITRFSLCLLACGLLAGCGLGETAVTAAATGASAARDAQQATQTEARATQQLNDAARVEAERRKEAEAAQ